MQSQAIFLQTDLFASNDAHLKKVREACIAVPIAH